MRIIAEVIEGRSNMALPPLNLEQLEPVIELLSDERGESLLFPPPCKCHAMVPLRLCSVTNPWPGGQPGSQPPLTGPKPLGRSPLFGPSHNPDQDDRSHGWERD